MNFYPLNAEDIKSTENERIKNAQATLKRTTKL